MYTAAFMPHVEVTSQGLNLAAINAETDRRGFVPVSEQMQVLDKGGKPISNVYCIGDANGKHLGCHYSAGTAVSDDMRHMHCVWLPARHVPLQGQPRPVTVSRSAQE